MLAEMLKELANDRLTIWKYADAPVGEALELVGGAREALESMYIVLDHIGPFDHTPASAYGIIH